uniref:Uncharacterized protein n=1 Tax=Knipowitschia caucasica TaxID=637954 RepID=A0AAV2MM66_KNICA
MACFSVRARPPCPTEPPPPFICLFRYLPPDQEQEESRTPFQRARRFIHHTAPVNVRSWLCLWTEVASAIERDGRYKRGDEEVGGSWLLARVVLKYKFSLRLWPRSQQQWEGSNTSS